MKHFISLNSTTLSKDEKQHLQLDNVTGVILYGRNIRSLKTTKEFIKTIKAVKQSLAIAIDEEGGIVSRFTHIIPNFSEPYCATLPDNEIRKYYRMRSEFLKDLGIDVNFAPVVDIAFEENSTMFKRSYGSTPENVTRPAQICLEEQKRAGIASCLKHFPGHGRTTTDSHDELPIINITMSDWESSEMKVYKHLIQMEPEYIMIGHLLYPKIDLTISSLSKFWVKEVLRDKLQYKGKIISDDICMDAIDSQNLSENQLDEIGLDSAIIDSTDHILLK
ncbi:MAG: glycoside hydrolase family 3 N-terminal domain-containing protein [Patescibacteria group bacterium]|nr:glycoside hydrolase family 3 N-terminal domain-containing protein [Patescibacteria group bacterium]